ncbi:uncharacterized protein LOC116263945 [Nymphaea colorata]|uniref:uncharacterized protein LOC116263945 n=1 Tax=Nymphaea colorata TaxID=210225 RepID=UPI00129DB90F|nr:uncharacterized protein LOC116263945 [Nymphaea colorata]
MFGRGNRRAEQAMASWFPGWGPTRSPPQPTMTTQGPVTTQPPSQQKPSAAAAPAPATQTQVPSSRTPASRPPPPSQPPAPPAGLKLPSPTAPTFQDPQTTRSVARQPQPRRQTPHMPTPPPQPMKVPSKTEPQLQPASQGQPSRAVDQKSNSQPPLSAAPATIPLDPNRQPASTVPSTLQTAAKPQKPQLASSSKAPATSPLDSKPQPASKTPLAKAAETEPILKPTQPQQTMTPSDRQVAAAAPPQSQSTSKGTSVLPPTTSGRLHPTATPIHSHGQTFGKPLTQIQDVGQEPSVSSKPEESNHIEEPEPIPKSSDVPRSETKVEILTFTPEVDALTTDDKAEGKEEAEKWENPSMKSPDSVHDPATLSAHRSSDVKTAVQREKEKETATIDKKATPPPPPPPPLRHVSLGSSDARGQETKTLVQVRQKDKHLESEVYQQEKARQGDQGLRRNIKEGISRLHDKLSDAQKPHLQEDPDVRVITLAGENKGAIMDISHGIKRKDGTLHIFRDYKVNREEKSEQSSDEEEREKNFHETGKPFMAYINNSAQSINNSIMYHSSCNNNNPGVHLSVTNNTTEPARQQSRIVPVEIPNTRPRKLLVEPTVRRRCLRSLFLESSDSDPENPEKPRRHGCRYGCPVPKKETSAAAGASHVANGHK